MQRVGCSSEMFFRNFHALGRYKPALVRINAAMKAQSFFSFIRCVFVSYRTIVLSLSLVIWFVSNGENCLAQPYAYFGSSSNQLHVLDTQTNDITASINIGMTPRGVSVHPSGRYVYATPMLGGYLAVVDALENKLLARINLPFSSYYNGVAVHPNGRFVYVVPQSGIQMFVIDTRELRIVRTVTLALSSDSIAVHPSGRHIYVTTTGAAQNILAVYDSFDYQLVKLVPYEAISSYGVVSHPNGRSVYVSMDTRHGGFVAVVNTADYSITDVISIGRVAGQLAIDPNGEFVYATDLADNRLKIISTTQNRVVSSILLPGEHTDHGISVTPDGRFVYMLIGSENYAQDPNMVVIDPRTETIVEELQLRPKGSNSIITSAYINGQFIGPDQIKINKCDQPKKKPYAYVPLRSQRKLAVINTTTNDVVKRIELDDEPYAVTLDPDGDYVYVTKAQGHTLSVIRTADNMLVGEFPLSTDGAAGADRYTAVTVHQNGRFIYVLGADRCEVKMLDKRGFQLLRSVTLPFGCGEGIAANPVKNEIYVSGNTRAYLLSGTTLDIIDTVTARSPQKAAAVHPTGNFLYLVNESADSLSVFKVDQPVASEGNPIPQYLELDNIPLGQNPQDIAVSAAGSRAYVTNMGSDSVTVIHIFNPHDSTYVEHRRLGDALVGTQPLACSLEPRGEQLFITTQGIGAVNVLDVSGVVPEEMQVKSVIDLPGTVAGLGGDFVGNLRPVDPSCEAGEKSGVVGDYNGDGKTDFTVYRRDDQTFYTRIGQREEVQIQGNIGTNSSSSVTGDFDGDGKYDYAVVTNNGGSLLWSIHRSIDGLVDARYWGLAGDIFLAADFDGDRKDEITIFRGGKWFILFDDGQVKTSTLGRAGDLPVPADYDGDGKADKAVFRPSDGKWRIKQSGYQTGFRKKQMVIKHWGLAGDIPVPFDFDGDGKVEPAVWRPSTGMWYLRSSHSKQVQWGLPGDVPSVGDFNGDGIPDLAVWRESIGGYWFINHRNGFQSIKQWGSNGDRPTLKSYSDMLM